MTKQLFPMIWKTGAARCTASGWCSRRWPRWAGMSTSGTIGATSWASWVHTGQPKALRTAATGEGYPLVEVSNIEASWTTWGRGGDVLLEPTHEEWGQYHFVDAAGVVVDMIQAEKEGAMKARNIGPTILRRLQPLGVRSVEDIRRLGPARYRSLAAANKGPRLPVAITCTASRPPSRDGTGGT